MVPIRSAAPMIDTRAAPFPPIAQHGQTRVLLTLLGPMPMVAVAFVTFVVLVRLVSRVAARSPSPTRKSLQQEL